MDMSSALRYLRAISSVRNSHAEKTPKRFKPSAAGAAFALTLSCVFAATPAQATTTAVGAIAGSAGVTPTGAATYSIPINMPPGTHGMQPSLSLVYNSQNGDGWAGYGWTIAGLSAITRCSQDIEDDGVNAAVSYQSSDEYCLDGQKLRVITGTSGGNGATYGTLIEGFSLITSYTDGNTSGGPSWFTVQTKDGRTYEYGNSSDSKILASGTTVVRTWALDKVTDASGNSMTYQYGSSPTPGREYWPTFINYTANGSTAADHQIEFDFTTRTSDIRVGFTHGSQSRNSQLLSAIKVKYLPNSTTTFTYTLTYDQDSVNGRNRLTSVQECAADGSCLPSTAITWTSSHAGWNGDVSAGISVTDPDSTVATDHALAAHLMDVDGDGIADLVYPDTTGTGHTGDWMVAFGQAAGGLGSPVDTGIADWGDYFKYALGMDYNGDGRADLMVPKSGGWLVLVATGNRTAGLGGIFTTPPNSIPDMSANNSVTNLPMYQGNVWMADFSGGDLSDMFDNTGSVLQWQQNSGPQPGGETFSSPTTVYSANGLKNFTDRSFADVGLDFNGSGRVGALAYNTAGNWVALNPSGNTLAVMDSVSGSGNVPALPFDANGDGLTDLLTVDNSGNWQISLSRGAVSAGDGLAFSTVSTGLAYFSNPFVTNDDPLVADYYGDGTQVAIVYSGSTWDLLDTSYNLGTGSFTATVTPIAQPYPLANYLAGSLRVGSIGSNGFDDLVYAVGNTGGTLYTWHYELHAGTASAYPDQVTKITDGLGNYCQFQYASLTDGSSTFTRGSANSYPIHSFQSSMQVVSSYTESDGLGGSYTLTYAYSDAEVDTQGHGFLGFASRTASDGRTGNTETISYDQAFPFTGMVTQDVSKKGNSDMIRETDNSGADQLSFGSTYNSRYFPFFDSSVTHDYDLVGSTVQEIRKTTTTVGASDFDPYGNLTDIVTTVMDKTQSGNPQYITETTTNYAAPASNYCVALPASKTVTRTVPAGSLGGTFPNPASRVVTYTPDAAHCRINSLTAASGQSGDGTPSLTSAYQYDSYGNVSEANVSGPGITTRISQVSFAGQNGEFPISSTNVVSGSVSLTSQGSWRYDLGLQSSTADANGNPSSVTYDGFGRPLQATRPDFSSTTWSYNWCSGIGTYCPSGAAYEITASKVSGTTTIVTGYTAYDMRGRPIEQGTVLLGGVMSRVDTTYDQFGTATSVSKPFTGSTPAFSTTYVYSQYLHRLKEIDAPQNGSDLCSPKCSDVTTIVYSGFTTTATQTVTDSASSSSAHSVQRTKDALGQVIGMQDTNNGVTTYNYDAFGDLVASRDAASHNTFMSYDGLGHKTGMTDPNMGTWSYQVDALGEITCQTDAKAQSIIMTYDGVGRVTSKLETAPGAGCGATTGVSSTWTYDTQTKGLGLPASISDSNGFERDYAYDSLSRPSDVTTTIDNTPYTISTSYDSFGRINTITYPVSQTPSSSSTPTALATVLPSATVNVGTLVTLDGSGSSPNPSSLQYQWRQTGGPVATGLDITEEKPKFTPDVGGTYSFQLQVVSANSALSTPSTVSVTVKPLAPAAPGLSPNPSTNGTVTLSWSSVSNVGSYNVWQSTDNTNFTPVKNVADSGTGSNSTNVTGLTNGTYYFALDSVANGVTGDRGSSASVLVTLPPGAPTGMSVSPSNQLPSTNYTASWTAPGSGTVTTYQLLEDNNSGFTSPTTYTINSPTHSKTLSKSTTGTYYYKVRACNQTACSSYSGTDSVVVMNVPAAPTLSASPATIQSGSSSTLSWTPHSSPVTSYIVQASASTTFNPNNQVYSGSGTSVSVSPTFTKYYRAQACNAVGCGNWSNTATVTVNLGGFLTPQTVDPMADETLYADMVEPIAREIGWDGDGIRTSVDEIPVLASLSERVPLPSDMVAMQSKPVSVGSLKTLAVERQALVATQLRQPAESTLQARADQLRRSMMPSLLPPVAGVPAPGQLLQSGNGNDGRPVYAPPVYVAYEDAKVQPVTNPSYRFTVQYAYDPSSGALQAVANADTGFIYWRAATDLGVAPVDAFGHLLGYVDGNNVDTVSTYDAATGVTASIGTTTPGASGDFDAQNLVYTWDGFGNLKQRHDVNHNLTETFGYDGLNRLTSSSVTTANGPGATLGMSYDAVGNIQTRTNTGITAGTGTLNDTYTYGDSSHPYAVTGVTSTGTYAYDANGNMISGNGRTVTWNDDNLPTSIVSSGTVNGNNSVNGSSVFSYAPDQQRYKQVTTDSIASNSTTLYAGGLFEVVSTASSTQYRHNIMAIGGVVAVHTIDQTGTVTTNYIHSDHLGSADTITNDQGIVAQQSSFDAFGLRRNPTTWAYNLSGMDISLLKNLTDRGYTFQEQLDSVGLVHMNGRVYDPSIGRFVSADPTIPEPFNNQAFNRYAYVYNNPLNTIDPSGFCGGDPNNLGNCPNAAGTTPIVVCTSGGACIPESPTDTPSVVSPDGGQSLCPNPCGLGTVEVVGHAGDSSTGNTDPGTGSGGDSGKGAGKDQGNGSGGKTKPPGTSPGAGSGSGGTCDAACVVQIQQILRDAHDPFLVWAKSVAFQNAGPPSASWLDQGAPKVEDGAGGGNYNPPTGGHIGPSRGPGPGNGGHGPGPVAGPSPGQVPGSGPNNNPPPVQPCTASGGGGASRANNPNAGRNILVTGGVAAGTAATVAVIVNIVGFPEVEAVEAVGGTSAALWMAIAGEPVTSNIIIAFNFGGLGFGVGTAVGAAFTQSVAPGCH
jgi:RHS repeat-associated protein